MIAPSALGMMSQPPPLFALVFESYSLYHTRKSVLLSEAFWHMNGVISKMRQTVQSPPQEVSAERVQLLVRRKPRTDALRLLFLRAP